MTDVTAWSPNDASNINTLGTNLGEGTALISKGNDADRAIMGAVRRLYDAWVGQWQTIAGKQAGDPTLTALAGVNGTADTFPYFSGPDTMLPAALTSLARSILAQSDAGAIRGLIGVNVTVASISLTNPGHLRLIVPGVGYPQLAWGSCTIAANTTTAVNYQTPFVNGSFAVLNAGRTNLGAQDNDPFVQATSASGFTAYSPSDTTNGGYYIAVGY